MEEEYFVKIYKKIIWLLVQQTMDYVVIIYNPSNMRKNSILNVMVMQNGFLVLLMHLLVECSLLVWIANYVFGMPKV